MKKKKVKNDGRRYKMDGEILEFALNLPEHEKENFTTFLARMLQGEKFTPEEITKMAEEGPDSVPVKNAVAARGAESNGLA